MTAEGSSLPNQPQLSPANKTLFRSSAARQFADGTGTLLAHFSGQGIDRRAWFSRGIPGLLLLGSLMGYGGWRWYYGFTRFGTVAAGAWSRSYFLVGALVAALLALWLILRKAQSRRVVEIFQNGLRVTNSRRKNHFWQWKEIGGLTSGSIESRFFGLAVNKKNWLTIYPKTGKPVRLDDRVQDLSNLARQLKEAYYSHRMPVLRSAFYADRWISFGPLAVHRQALRVKKKLYPWKLVQDISVQAGSLVITITGMRNFRFPIRKIPNLELMISIIQEGVIS